MLFDKINILLPTRNRIERLSRHIKSAVELCDNIDNIAYSFLVDDDDINTLYWLEQSIGKLNLKTDLIIRKNTDPNLAECYNILYEKSSYNGLNFIVGMVGDDMVWETTGWDSAILNAANSDKGKSIIYCNDAYIQGEKLTVNLFVSRQLVNDTAHPFMCPLFPMNFIDTVWTIIGGKLGILHYLPDVILHHYHNSALPPENRDETHKRLQSVYVPMKHGYKVASEYADSIITILRNKGYGCK